MNEPRDSDSERIFEPGVAWSLVRLRQCAIDSRRTAAAIERALEAFDPETGLDASGIVLTHDDLETITGVARELQDHGDIAGVIADTVASQREVVVISPEELEHEAALALRTGTGDRSSVLASAAFLDARIGFALLADTISMDPALVAQWGAFPVADVLARFRNADPALVRQVCAASSIDEDDEWNRLDIDQLEQLARELRRPRGA